MPGYTVLEALGRGADTVVYRVRRGDADYAMKVRAGSGWVDDQVLSAFRREAALLALADHPTLPRVHEVGVARGGPYLVMDLIEGRPLASVLRSGPMGEDAVRRIAVEVAEALAAAHRVGLVHRDIKPQNIMVQPDGQARLIDFGLATMTADHVTDMVVGTLAYAAPEQAGTLKRIVDARSDLYSLGVVLFECATGRPPFASADVGELLRLHASVPAPDVRTLRPELSESLATTIATLLAKDPDDRYDGGDMVVADLRRSELGGAGEFGPATPPEPDRMADRVVLIGRDDELSALHGRWADTRAGLGCAVVVRGGQGSGKSRLLEELTADVRSDGFPALYAQADDGAPLAPLRRSVEEYLAWTQRMAPAAREAARAHLLTAAAPVAAHVRTLSPMLADLLSSTGTGSSETAGTDELIPAIAGFLVDWARGCGGALFCVDDVERLDGATQRVLAQLTATSRGAPLLIVAGMSVDVDLGTVRAFQDGMVDLTITLQPFDDAMAARLIAALSGGMDLGQELVGLLAGRSGRTPLEITEYVTAVVDAGLLSPAWGSWVLDVEGLDGLALPSDVLGLIGRRIDGTGGATQQLLAMAAVIGQHFDGALVARLAAADDIDDTTGLLEDAVGHGILVHHQNDYAFIHSRARSALFDRMDADRIRVLHQRVAIELDTGDEAERYAVARHYLLGTAERTPVRAAGACLDAAELALTRHAGEEAVEFLTQALQLTAALPPTEGFDPARIRSRLADAYAMAGRVADTIALLEDSLTATVDPIERARILLRIAWAKKIIWEMDGAFTAAARGVAEVGGALPTSRLLLALTSIRAYAAGKIVEVSTVGFGTATGERRQRMQVLAELLQIAGEAAVRTGQPMMSMALIMRGLYPAARLGPSPAYIHQCGSRAVISMIARLPGAGRGLARAERAAASTGLPEAHALVQYCLALGPLLAKSADEQPMSRVITEVGHLLPVGEYLDAVGLVCTSMINRGLTRDARGWYDRAIARLDAADLPTHGMELVGLTTAAGLGRVAETDVRLRHVTAEDSVLTQTAMRVLVLSAAAMVAVEQRDLGERFIRIAADFAALKVKPRLLYTPRRLVFATLAYGMLERCRTVPAEQRAAAVAGAEQAVAALRRVPSGPIIDAHILVTGADLRLVSGDPRGALAALSVVDSYLIDDPVPLAAYEAARVRARAHTELGNVFEGTGYALLAASLADRYGWPHRADWIRAEFDITERVSRSADMAAAGRSDTIHSSASLSADGRRLAALEQLSLAASRIVDPMELTRVALDQTIQILAAERAFLFLTEDDDARLVPHLGRDRAGNDIITLTEYGSTLVERVRADRQPLVVTGTDEGATLGSQSAVVHGLRSIIVAPLLLDTRLMGVVYVDSRVAKGMFTTADVGTLTAITTHIAAALETARAAQLGSAVQAAQERLGIAETIRDAMTDLAATLDAREVLATLHTTMARVLPADTAHLFVLDGDRLIRISDPPDSERTVQSVPPGGRLERLLHHEPIAVADPEQARALGLDPAPAASVLTIPLRTRDRTVGMLVLITAAPDVYGATEVEVAAALAAHSMIAYDNARLFAEVRQLAVTDSLTGICNRHQFFILATEALQESALEHTDLSAVMLDIDSFKRVNDTHGHPVGDQVIKAVAARLSRVTRDGDLVARYGGEEFALILVHPVGLTLQIAERIRAAIADTPIDTDAGPLPITVSVGIAHRGHDESDPGPLLNAADQALYQAKQQGRNRVVVYGTP